MHFASKYANRYPFVPVYLHSTWMSFLHIWGRRWCNLFKFCLGGAVDGCAVSCNVVMPRPRCELCWEHRPYLRRLCPTCGRRVGAGLPPSLLHGSRSWRRRTRILPSAPNLPPLSHLSSNLPLLTPSLEEEEEKVRRSHRRVMSGKARAGAKSPFRATKVP